MSDYYGRLMALLGDQDPIEVLHATPLQLAQLAEEAAAGWFDEPCAPGKWRRRYLLAHLADVELATAWRLRQTVAVPGIVHTLYDQDVWAERYARTDPMLALEAFRSVRAWNLAWLAGLTLQDWLAEGVHPERGPESVDQMVRFLAGHDLNHLEQLIRD